MQKAPIYTFGSITPEPMRSGLAGSMIFELFDRSALYECLKIEQEFRDQEEFEQIQWESELYDISELTNSKEV